MSFRTAVLASVSVPWWGIHEGTEVTVKAYVCGSADTMLI